MLGRGFGRIDPERFDRVNRVQNFLDLRPARDPQENVCAWLHVWRHGVGSPGATARRMSICDRIVP
jgi:hypothetical protein